MNEFIKKDNELKESIIDEIVSVIAKNDISINVAIKLLESAKERMMVVTKVANPQKSNSID